MPRVLCAFSLKLTSKMTSLVGARLVSSSCRNASFLMRQGLAQSTTASFAKQRRRFSSSPSRYTHLDVKSNADKGYAVVTMNRKPVNGLSLELLTELNIALEKLENDKTCRGYILTSGLPAFCAGIELTELYQPQPDRLRTFWRSFQDLSLRLHSSPLVNIAAINGSAPAGGCALSMTCDYRILADGKTVIGLNESLLGIVAPFWLRKLAAYTVGTREADKMLQLGTLYPASQALAVGVVDKVVPREKVVEEAESTMMEWLQVPDTGRRLTKQLLRQPWVEDFNRGREKDENDFVGLVTKDGIQKYLGIYLESLSKKK